MHEIIMPQMGESVVEGTILKWLVDEGQRVEKDHPLVEISTDKIDTEIPSPFSGILKTIVHKQDETVPVGKVIAFIEEFKDDEKIPPPLNPLPRGEGKLMVQTGGEGAKLISPPLRGVPSFVPSPLTGEGQGGGEQEQRNIFTPLVKRLSREYGIDLDEINKITGTGAGGRITKDDILDYVERTQKMPLIAIAKPSPVEAIKPETREEIIPLSNKRRIIAERMVKSKTEIPHVTTTFEADLTGITRFRSLNKDIILKEHGVHLTFLPFIINAVTSTIRKYPILNAMWNGNEIIIKKYINIGIAVSLEDGLIVPVIKDADKKGLVELARESQELAKRAREKNLGLEDLQDGTFTITNYGIGGSLFGTPIILPSQTAILGIGAIMKRAVVIGDAIAIRDMVYLSLSFDHRVIDGAQADRFMADVKEDLEGWRGKIEKVSADASGFGGVW
ncbi:MAG: 2-oxo acid dehydrogenase subunit E2 [Nitrospirae bacterium]|nr:2-oxo acid dehydrogenase subunit E2 [Nitrospirota bacterium]